MFISLVRLSQITREVSEVSLEVAEPTPSATRVTKAQKRRDKKKQKERERLEEIEKQEELNKTGQRAVETEKIKSLLSSRLCLARSHAPFPFLQSQLD